MIYQREWSLRKKLYGKMVKKKIVVLLLNYSYLNNKSIWLSISLNIPFYLTDLEGIKSFGRKIMLSEISGNTFSRKKGNNGTWISGKC